MAVENPPSIYECMAFWYMVLPEGKKTRAQLRMVVDTLLTEEKKIIVIHDSLGSPCHDTFFFETGVTG